TCSSALMMTSFAGAAARVEVIENRTRRRVRNFSASQKLHAGRDLIREVNLPLESARDGENRLFIEPPAHDLDSEGEIPAGEARRDGDRRKPGERRRDREDVREIHR